MAPLEPSELAARMLVWQLRTTADHAAATVTNWLSMCLEHLTVLAAAIDVSTAVAGEDRGDRLRAVGTIHTSLQACADAVAARQASFNTLFDLQAAAVMLRFVHPEPQELDTPDTDNPLYNITIWLLDAIRDCTTLLHAEQGLDTAAHYGVPGTGRPATP